MLILPVMGFREMIPGWLTDDVVQRFRTYNLPLSSATPETLEWIRKMWSDAKMREIASDYFRQAADPKTRIEKYDDIFAGNPEIEYGKFEEDWQFELPV
jgi:hypothetical protein